MGIKENQKAQAQPRAATCLEEPGRSHPPPGPPAPGVLWLLCPTVGQLCGATPTPGSGDQAEAGRPRQPRGPLPVPPTPESPSSATSCSESPISGSTSGESDLRHQGITLGRAGKDRRESRSLRESRGWGRSWSQGLGWFLWKSPESIMSLLGSQTIHAPCSCRIKPDVLGLAFRAPSHSFPTQAT